MYLMQRSLPQFSIVYFILISGNLYFDVCHFSWYHWRRFSLCPWISHRVFTATEYELGFTRVSMGDLGRIARGYQAGIQEGHQTCIWEGFHSGIYKGIMFCCHLRVSLYKSRVSYFIESYWNLFGLILWRLVPSSIKFWINKFFTEKEKTF